MTRVTQKIKPLPRCMQLYSRFCPTTADHQQNIADAILLQAALPVLYLRRFACDFCASVFLSKQLYHIW